MPTPTKRANGTWQIKIRLAEHPTESQVFDSKTKGMAWGYKREEELRNQAKGIVKATFQDAIDRYIKDVCPTHKAGANEAKRLLALSKLPGLLPTQRLLPDVTAVDLSRFRDTRLAKVSIGTVRKEMTIVRSVLESARRDWGMITINPITDVKRPPSPADRKRLFTEDEANKIIMTLGYTDQIVTVQHQVAVALLLAFETGMRAGEMIGLPWSDVHLEAKYVHLPETKNGGERDVALSSKAIDLINKLKGLNKTYVFTLTSASLDALFRKARDKHNIENLHFHDSRANAITALSKKLDVLTLAKMIGHKDINNLMIYYRESATDTAEKLI